MPLNMPTNVPLFLAVDAGGTKTDFVLASDTAVLARVRTGTIKRLRTGADAARLNLETALAALQQQSGMPLQAVCRTCVGTAGESVPLVADFLRAELSSRVAGQLLLVGDVEIALDAAFHGGDGVLILAGTGSNVAGRSADGRLTTCGGYGPVLADQGSGHWIGLEALRAMFLSLDEGRPSVLRESILDQWKLKSVEDLISYANSRPTPDFSTLVELVVRAAEANDAVALSVLRAQGEQLGYLARLVLRRMQPATPTLACAGSILEHVVQLRDAVLAEVQVEFPNAEMLPGVVDPIDGALWRVRDADAFTMRLAQMASTL